MAIKFFDEGGSLWIEDRHPHTPRKGEIVVLPSGKEYIVTRVAHDLSSGVLAYPDVVVHIEDLVAYQRRIEHENRERG